MHALKVKFVTTLLTHIKTPTKLLINYNIEYEKIVETAKRMQADNARDPARAITNRGKTFYFNKEERKIRQKTPEERGRSLGFQRSTWKIGDSLGQGESALDKPKRSYSPRFTPSRKGPTKPRQGNKVFRQISDQEKESLKAEGKYLIYKESGYYTRDCPKKKSISTAYNQVSQRKSWQQRTPFQGSRLWSSTAALEIIRPPQDDRKHLILQTAKISCATMIQISGKNIQALIDPCTINGNLISNQFYDMYKIPTEKTHQKILGTASKGRKSYTDAKATVEVDLQGYKQTIIFYVANLNEWNAILGNSALTTLRAVIDIAENQVSIYSRGKEPTVLQMLDKQTIEYLLTAAQYIHLYAEEVTDYSEAETYAGHRSTGHLQNFLKEMEWENNSTLILERLSPIEEEIELEEDYTQKWIRLNEEKENIDKEVYAQLVQIPDTLKQRIGNYRRKLEEFHCNLEQDWKVLADAEDNPAANILIAQEEYDADPDSTDSETAL